jgi:hypothetical protein
MKSILLTLVLCAVTGIAVLPAAVSLESSYIVPIDDPAIRYVDRGRRNAVARLQDRIGAAQIRLGYDAVAGYVPALLEALDVPVSSQVLVFSKTSFQANRIYPHNPRAIYFNDSVAIGHVPGSDLLEITATDPDAGVVFFTLDQTETGTPAITRRTHECLQCHAIPRTLGVPGLVVRSVYPDRTGMPVFRAGSFFTDHRSPLEQRWGGWYVTGTHGAARHMGNRFAVDDAGTLEAGEPDVTALTRFFDTKRHITPHSDLVALMVLEHQVRLTNLITRIGWETKLALADHASRAALSKESVSEWSASTRRRVEQPAEVLLRSLLMIDESPLTSPVKGTSTFARDYSARGPRDGRQRSLFELDLNRRLYRYRCSPLIYSEQFAGLPAEVREYLFRRLVEVLDGTDRTADFAGVSDDERRDVLAILKDTIPELAR